METGELIGALAIAVVLGGALAWLFWKQRRDVKKGTLQNQTNDTMNPAAYQLQLQAYERLILLTERIALNNLINRVNQPGLSAREMQAILTQTIRQEFEYNVTQQIYVTPEAWDAVRNLKDQNIHIVNQVASFLPAEATGQDLNRSILEMMLQNPKASLHSVVSEVLSYEAKKLMK
jgi:hypothetical protein